MCVSRTYDGGDQEADCIACTNTNGSLRQELQKRETGNSGWVEVQHEIQCFSVKKKTRDGKEGKVVYPH